LSLVEIADHFNKSTGYISVIFKRERGTNYNNYVNEKRIEEAVRLMATNTMDLQSISDAVGYTNLARFTKNFQKYTGHNPM
jgi:YesN/AraC family two-component response regulator